MTEKMHLSAYGYCSRYLDKELPLDAYWVNTPPIAAIRMTARRFFNYGLDCYKHNLLDFIQAESYEESDSCERVIRVSDLITFCETK